MELTPDQRITRAGEQLEAGEPRAAFAALRGVFREPDFAEQTPELVAALRLFSRIAEALNLEQFAAIAERAADFPDEVQALYDLGYEGLENDLHWLAACVLERAFARAPDTAGVLSELVAALEGGGRYAEARAYLKGAPILLAGSFLLRYLYAFTTMMCGDADAVPALVERLGEPGDDTEAFMKARIAGMLARVEVARTVGPLDNTDLRGWHFVVTGGVLLHLSPFGFEDGMRGRYAYTQDSWARCAEGLELLRDAMAGWAVKPPRILALPDRGSQIVAAAAGRMLSVPVEAYDPDRPGLIVAYDLGRLDADTPIELLEHRPGQILYAHATCWTDTPACAPDLTMYLYQTNVAPWDERTRFGEEEIETVPADDGPVDELAQRIADAAGQEPDEEDLAANAAEQRVAFVKAARKLASAFVEAGRRSPLWEGGPVQSSRFG